MSSKYKHVEAFCLMQYVDTQGDVEFIWNSRDGVTPFVVRSRQGHDAKHVNWRADVRAINHKPRSGDRIFVDMTLERAQEIATARVSAFWDHSECPAREMYATKEEGVAKLTPGIFGDGHQPMLIEVP